MPLPWYLQLLIGDGAAGLLVALALVAASGIALGSFKIKGISLGIAGVLFTGILWGHLAWKEERVVAVLDHAAASQAVALPAPAPSATAPSSLSSAVSADPAAVAAAAATAQHDRADKLAHKRKEVLEFLREFGLILFVYTIGMQVGPGFVASLRRQGLRWNALAASVVFGGVATAWLVHVLADVPVPVVVGLLSGAVTNTPGLGAAQQALAGVPGAKELAATGYAIAYPFGVLGIILTMILFRVVFRIDPQAEAKVFVESGVASRPSLQNVDLEVQNPGIIGRTVHEVLAMVDDQAVISRMKRAERVFSPDHDVERLLAGDVLHAVGEPAALDRLQMLVGVRSAIDLRAETRQLMARRLIVTNQRTVGRTIAELAFDTRHGVNITRVNRSGVEFVASDNLRLNFADVLVCVGPETGLDAVAKLVGNSAKQLDHPQLIPLFVGILLGVTVGMIPVFIPGIPAPVKLGLAGGPLVVAILLSRLGRWGRLNFYIPNSANLMLREFGIVLFLACVGLMAGDQFFDRVLTTQGLTWMGLAACITVVPLLLVGLVARLVFKLNFMALMGLLSGSMTDPPALAFANTVAGAEHPAVTYATIYPLTMLLRIVTAQVLVIVLLA